jgi:ATP-dependent RNA helicase RhlE
MSFTNLGLAPEILHALQSTGYTTPTPIQDQAIPLALAGHDLLGCAQTGTGKTAAFILPILNRFRGEQPRRLRALILVPTRELAAQVAESARQYSRYGRLTVAVVYGGVSLLPQELQLRRGVDILVATPGRLLDHMERRNVDCRQIEVLVLDEADRMLDMGFIQDIRRVIKVLPTRRQTMLFSATLPSDIRKLAKEILKDPKLIEVTPEAPAAEGVELVVYPVSADQKKGLLKHLITAEKMTHVMVFTKTKNGANRLSLFLEKSRFKTEVIHGNKTQSARTQALEAFKRGNAQILVATDVASRGLHIEGVSHVINYDIPHLPESYIHRIGRTGRMGKKGNAISLMSPEERGSIRAIEHLMNKRIPEKQITGLTSNPVMFHRHEISQSPKRGRFGHRTGNTARRSEATFSR